MWKWTNTTACICHELVDEIVIKKSREHQVENDVIV